MAALDDAVRNADGMFASLFENSVDCMHLLDLDGNVRAVNPAGLAIMGLTTVASVAGRSWIELWPEEHRLQAGESLAAANGRGASRFTATSPTPAGDPRTWDVVVSALRQAGEPVGLVATVRDVTEISLARQEAMAREAALERSLAALHSAGRIARVAGWEADWRTGHVYFSNELWEMMGSGPRSLPFDESMEFWGENHRARVRELTAESAVSGERLLFEAECMTSNGLLWVRVLADPVIEDGVCTGFRGVVQDITVERQARARLEESERFTRGVIDGMAATICVLDAQGRVVSANEAWRRFREKNSRSMGGDGMGIDYREACRQRLGRTGKSLARLIDDILNARRDTAEIEFPMHIPGEKRWVKLNAYRVPGDGPLRVVVMHQPITELKLSERRLRRANAVLRSANRAAKSASDAKSAFLATMSHEIRTPLNGVLGMVQAMAHDELPEHQRQRLAVVRQSGEALLMLLNDVLDLSKIEAGKLEIEDGLVDMEALAEAARAAFEPLAAGKSLHFGLDITPEARGCWRGDPTRVRQVLYNLVSNAVKFTEEGSVQVEISHDGDLLILRVADTGPGVMGEMRARMFQKFVQADASTTRRYGGSGLGLAICRDLVAMMGGEISMDSIPYSGTTFCVRLPLPRAAPAAGVAAETPRLRSPQVGLRVLAAEDNPMNVLVLKTLLGQVGVQPHVVSDGAQAVQAWESGAWDLILMDVQMPVMDGPTAAKRIRQRERARGGPRTPIIALTANAMAHHAAEYTAAGMDAMVSKPINLAHLLATVDSVLSLDEDGAEAQAAIA